MRVVSVGNRKLFHQGRSRLANVERVLPLDIIQCREHDVEKYEPGDRGQRVALGAASARVERVIQRVVGRAIRVLPCTKGRVDCVGGQGTQVGQVGGQPGRYPDAPPAGPLDSSFRGVKCSRDVGRAKVDGEIVLHHLLKDIEELE